MKLSLSVFGSTTSTVEAPRGAQYSRLSGPAQIPLFSLPCFLPLRPPVPEPVNGGRRCRACGAFRRPPLAVRRACLKSFSLALAWPKSARIGSYGPRQGRRPPFEESDLGSKIVLNLYLFLSRFQAASKAILEARMEAKIEATSSPRAFQDALGAGLPLEAILASMLVHFWTSGTPKNHALAVARCYFCRK